MYEVLSKFPLRKINFVKTRVAILNAVRTLLQEKNFTDITVDEICQKAQISRGTFFNYFAGKENVFDYYLRIFTIKVSLRISEWRDTKSFDEKIAAIYEWMKDEQEYPKFIDNYISFLLNKGFFQEEVKLSEAEFVFFFEEITPDKYDAYNELTLQTIFEDICQKSNEIVPVDKLQLGHMFASLLIGTYVADTLDPSTEHLSKFTKILCA
ncbi:MAG: TetR family transcriptional regulator [Epulopiscium sp. Nele67-Bin004]|nr:MAG: TetR family transcriptional regulator [Epulopiscium sp. Nele67-Bin004]